MKNCYAALGITLSADEKAIKGAYRKLAMLHHPDRNPGNEEAAERFRMIQGAYDTLTDPVKKLEHDLELKTGPYAPFRDASENKPQKTYRGTWSAFDGDEAIEVEGIISKLMNQPRVV